jgi:hypothetical protein
MSEENKIEESQKSEDRSPKEIHGNETANIESSTSNEELETADSKLETKNMEVHHHPQLAHKAKPWKEYLLEGLMIFLAVTLGFFAENFREHITENNRENEFAKVLYAELKDDSAAAANKLASRLEKEKEMDYLSDFFKDSSLTDLPKRVYPAFTISLYLINNYSFEPKDGILSQLRNSGSLRYFKSVELQKLLGDLSVNINNIRYRNEQEYQFFASPVKPFMLKFYDWSWLDKLRNEDTVGIVVDVIKRYYKSNRVLESKILNISSFDRGEASNMILFYKQMLVSTRSLQLNNYIITNHKILHVLRTNYSLENE